MKMQVPQERLKRMLEIYKPDCRYLIGTSIEYPKAEGRFKLGKIFYATRPVEHMTIIEAQLCLNQLCYSAFGEWLPEGRLNERVSFDRFLELMKENMFAVESNIRFRKPIPTNGEIQGQIELMKVKRHGNLYLIFCDYELEQGKSKGSLELVLKL